MDEHLHLSRRERQIMDILYTHGQVTCAQVQRELPDPPSAMAVRRMMQILEEKGHVRREKHEREVLYVPTRPRDQAGKADLRRVLRTFFSGSLAGAFTAHLEDPQTTLSDDELKRLARAIRAARKKGN